MKPYGASELEHWGDPYQNMTFCLGPSYAVPMATTRFDWDADKEAENRGKAWGFVFPRPIRLCGPKARDCQGRTHSQTEERFYCFGEVDGGVLTVRFTYRALAIRIIGAGYWRKGKANYERENAT